MKRKTNLRLEGRSRRLRFCLFVSPKTEFDIRLKRIFMMRRAIAVFGLLSVFALAGFLMIIPNGASRAAGDAVFLIPASDGYGVADCLTGGNECGVIVADAWCEAHGFSKADSFGLATDEVTGSIETALPSGSERPIAITCAD
jgi:hypothetical protein